MYNTRAPRPNEREGIQYYFRRREEVEVLREDKNYLLVGVRDDLQALDLGRLRRLTARGDALFEGSTFVSRELVTDPRLHDLPHLSVFVSPLSREEILFLRARQDVNLEEFVTEIMRRKLLRRKTDQKQVISLVDLEDIERRAATAYEELAQAHRFDVVLPSHDGEDHDHWAISPYPLGDARAALLNLATLLTDGEAPRAEKWEADLVP